MAWFRKFNFCTTPSKYLAKSFSWVFPTVMTDRILILNTSVFYKHIDKQVK